ncbi:UbiA prenyltransferase family protein [Algoriphagus aestuarii]|nr:UbiA prenyltransferase family protein [Algoriphagus aestuarii]
MLTSILKLVRVRHWVKNIFVFLPLFFAGDFFLIFQSSIILLFISFCMAASTIYVLNDIVDVENDRLHPEKKKRPLASGSITQNTAYLILGFFFLGFVATLVFLGSSAWYVVGYFVLNIIYSFYLKNISIVDVSCISLGFVLRVMAGGSEADIFVSHWMIILIFLLTISLAFAKRRDDLVIDDNRTVFRKSSKGYSLVFLDVATSISFSITLISYILYSISPETIERLDSDKLYISSLFVFLGIMRYLQITIIDKNSGSPVEVLIKDRFLQINILIWIGTIAFFIYG